MQFGQIINARLSKESDRPLMQKDPIPVSGSLYNYLIKNGRGTNLPIAYSDLVYYSHSNALRDKEGKLTHWETAIFDAEDRSRLNDALLKTYVILKSRVTPGFTGNIEIVQIDFCEFGNSVPFRVLVRFRDTGVTDQYYIKMADASRIYGLELEQLISPGFTNFLVKGNTLVESHIPGMPGDVFLKDHLKHSLEKRSIARQFVQFNERCFARLLGDMRSYNFVIYASGKSDDSCGMRPIDFDQQCYEGRKNLYLPQFYKENHAFVELVLDQLEPREIAQFQEEEREQMRKRIRQQLPRMLELLDCLSRDELSENYKILSLRRELNEHFNTTAFTACHTMGDLVKCQLQQVLGKTLLDVKQK